MNTKDNGVTRYTGMTDSQVQNPSKAVSCLDLQRKIPFTLTKNIWKAFPTN